MRPSLRGIGWALAILAGVLIIGWAVAIVVSWDHIVSSHTRLGYLIADVGLVTPVCVSAVGLFRGRPWAPSVTLLTVGALAYDAVHFAVYLMQERFLGIPIAVYLLLLAVILGFLAAFTRSALHAIRAAD